MAPSGNGALAVVVSFCAGAAVAGCAAAAGLVLRQRRVKGSCNTAPATSTAHAARPPPAFEHPPHPTWKAGVPGSLPSPYEGGGVVAFDPTTLDKGSLYSLMISCVVPRPIGFVSSIGADGSANLAPYSYFNMVSHSPPIVVLGCCRHGGRPKTSDGSPAKKDTLENIEETREFVVHIISDWYVEAANHTCGDFDRGVDESTLAGLTPVASTLVKPRRMAEAAVAFECELERLVELEDASGPSCTVVLGRVVMMHVAKDVTEASPTGKVVVDPTKLRPVCKLGGVTYGRLGGLFEIARPRADGTMPEVKTKAEAADEARAAALR
ncbi:hypothetical protein FOA52_003062 [Chlamydomonas sp. UWO 241]|nr:hypothetical protein FOA52_003062 [Chlamydomonas sp. UWO 241]